MIKKQKIYTAGSLDLLEWNFDFHNLMLADSLRMNTYKKAIFETIKPGMIVCDVGLGTGILTKWALEAGAERVYGIEMNKDILEIAKQKLLPFGGKFIPVFGLSYNIELPEKVDCILSEILGNIMDNEDCVSILEDIEKRFLKKDGFMLPEFVSSYITPVSYIEGNTAISTRNITLAHIHSPLVKKMQNLEINELYNLYYDAIIDSSRYLSCPQIVSQMKQSSYQKTYSKKLTYEVSKTGIFSGFKGHFKAQLSSKTMLSIESAKNYSPSWKHAYFPIQKSIKIQQGDIINLIFNRNINNSYQWKGNIERNGKKIYQFKQELKELFN